MDIIQKASFVAEIQKQLSSLDLYEQVEILQMAVADTEATLMRRRHDEQSQAMGSVASMMKAGCPRPE